MKHVGIIGIGIMGTAYAENLLAAGFTVSGWDCDGSRVDALGGRGGIAMASAAEVADAADLVITALPGADALTEAVAGETGLAAGSHDGLVLAEMSTLPLDAKLRAREMLEPLGVAVLDAPVSGTGLQAAAADIAVYASGDPAALMSARPVFDTIGRTTFDLGEFGNGSRMKYVANLLVSVHNLATAEAFVLGMQGGLAPERIHEVISASVASSGIFEIRGPMMVADDYPAAARLKMFIKDISVITEFARDVGSPTPLLETSRAFYEEATEAGLGDLDAAALCRLLEDKAGYAR
ncbi:MAG: NAD(P)-dependent oxidoreductase [Acidimicrobiia bacterium]|nr:NAD(P)-dependent oxidoreductase [Acidimicrobiia bacterium]